MKKGSWLLPAFCIVLGLFDTKAYSNQVSSSPSHPEGFQNIVWGASLRDFRSSQGSKVTYSIDKMDAWALDYLLMDFHEVDKNDPARVPKFSVQEVPGDPSVYIFYDGKFCAATTPVQREKFSKTQEDLKSAYSFLGDKSGVGQDGFFGDWGQKRVIFRYKGFALSPQTRIYLLKITSFYEDPTYYSNKAYTMVQATGGGWEKALLIYVPDDYFKGENAYTDWLENRKSPRMNKLTYLEQLKCSIQH